MSDKKQQTAYPLRMPAELREKLEKSAFESKRSINAEIVARLEESYSPTVNPAAPLTIRRKGDGGLPSENVSVLPSPDALMSVISDMAENLRKMAAEVKDLKKGK
ncbi:Arc family DNA-binding protein [Pseudomonas sp. GD03860]|uniref:Arc family DNA-binding protein n=1 Tax=Pseudomonas sp. GD03860 TaxID=2975389 RepID=UPI0024498D67|nr:Arc family DNA-binding protein [Pseudomonas sp. GD03860]MDH0638190.1 Arc family DNA-binding protein [Pseudomonas sp. GD03860]